MNTVEPLRDAELLGRIQRELEAEENEHWRRIYLLFMTGIYTGLRISDIVRLRVENVNNGDKIRLREKKTEKWGKQANIKINPILRAVFDDRLEGKNPKDFLFPSRQRDNQGRVKPITTVTAENDLKLIKQRYNIRFPFSCHSLRKTFGYWHYKKYGDLEALRQHFNHSTETVTRRYIGIDEEERNRMIEGLRIGNYTPNRAKPAKKRSNKLNKPVETKYHDRTKQGAIYKGKAQGQLTKVKEARGIL